MHSPSYISKRDPTWVFILCLVTCGVYLIVWYYKIYGEIEALAGRTPTGGSFVRDLLFTVLTCGLFGIWVDYQMSVIFNELQARYQVANPNDTTTTCLVLDLCAFVTGYITNLIATVIHQDQMNRVLEASRTISALPSI